MLAEIRGEFFDARNSGVFHNAATDLHDGGFWNPGRISNRLPAPLSGLKVIHYEIVDWLTHERRW